MTNDHAIVLAAATMLGKEWRDHRGYLQYANTPELALELARQMMVAQQESTRQRVGAGGMSIAQRIAMNGKE
jgi:hypothetical protein